jgi:catechol 2,3-dioxygenase-like lactoylglutathione lyase family enzyme
MAEDRPTFPTRQLHHVGVVVKDLEKAIAQMEALGFGPFMFDDEHRTFAIDFKGELHGEPAEWTTLISNGKMGDVELELLEPVAGNQALKETLDAQGEGLHHIGWLTTDLQGDMEKAKAAGAKIWTSSIVPGQPGFCYFENSAIGNVAIELREP